MAFLSDILVAGYVDLPHHTEKIFFRITRELMMIFVGLTGVKGKPKVR